MDDAPLISARPTAPRWPLQVLLILLAGLARQPEHLPVARLGGQRTGRRGRALHVDVDRIAGERVGQRGVPVDRYGRELGALPGRRRGADRVIDARDICACA